MRLLIFPPVAAVSSIMHVLCLLFLHVMGLDCGLKPSQSLGQDRQGIWAVRTSSEVGLGSLIRSRLEGEGVVHLY